MPYIHGTDSKAISGDISKHTNWQIKNKQQYNINRKIDETSLPLFLSRTHDPCGPLRPVTTLHCCLLLASWTASGSVKLVLWRYPQTRLKHGQQQVTFVGVWYRNVKPSISGHISTHRN